MEGLDGLQPPCLALGAFGVGPVHGLPIRRNHQAGTGVAQLDPVASGLVDVEEEGLLDGVLVRTGLDEDALVDGQVGGANPALLSTAKAMWCRRPVVPVQSRV
jgi:hypothetical protein